MEATSSLPAMNRPQSVYLISGIFLALSYTYKGNKQDHFFDGWGYNTGNSIIKNKIYFWVSIPRIKLWKYLKFPEAREGSYGKTLFLQEMKSKCLCCLAGRVNYS